MNKMIKIKDGCWIDLKDGKLPEIVGKKISIHEYNRADYQKDGFRFGTIESISLPRSILVSFQDDCHHAKKTISRYLLRSIVDGVIHD